MGKNEPQGVAEGPRFVVVAPTFNHRAALGGVLAALEPLGMAVIAVDDGSRDGTEEVLRGWAGDNSARVIVTHPENQGKGAALRTGFGEAERRGFSHAVTIDTDGQHNPADVRGLLKASRENPGALVVGARARRIVAYPLASRFGRWVSNGLVRLESGLRVSDSQSGMRVYPLEGVRALGARAGRYAFETEILTRAGWAGMRVVEVPIGCVYRVPEGRVSHFRTGRDSVSGLVMHLGLCLRACLPGDPVPRVSGRACAGTGTAFRRLCRGLRWSLGGVAPAAAGMKK